MATRERSPLVHGLWAGRNECPPCESAGSDFLLVVGEGAEVSVPGMAPGKWSGPKVGPSWASLP